MTSCSELPHCHATSSAISHTKPAQQPLFSSYRTDSSNPPLSDSTRHQIDPKRSYKRTIDMNADEWHEHYKHDLFGRDQWFGHDEKMRQKYERLPEITLSASTEAGVPEASISVIKQRAYTGRYPVIPSSLADTPCTRLGVEGILEKLNNILGTSYTLEMRSLSSLLDAYILEDYDFGTVFSRLRQFWYDDLTNIQDELHFHEARDQQMRQDVLANNKIISHCLPPRRVWDLYSNRVIPWWAGRIYSFAISHAWMEEEYRTNAQTRINGNEWPVPMPKDGNLDLIRIEMLNCGAEYAWLDVLCLRQVGGQEEDLRAEEWKVDVPTIGVVYRMSHGGVVCYLSGLGRPLTLKEEDLESDRCWFKRAWTLQETHNCMSIGGDTGDDRFISKEMRARIENRLSQLRETSVLSGQGMHTSIALSEMQMRASTNPVDRVAGLSYILWTGEIPACYASQSQEEAWTALVDAMYETIRGHLFFLYPKAGDGKQCWRPSWKQAMTGALPSSQLTMPLFGFVSHVEDNNADAYHGPCIESGYVRGLGKESPEGKRREGELLVKDITGGKHTFKVIAYHQYLIPEGLYTLVGSDAHLGGEFNEEQCWVVGERLPEGTFKKVSVFMMTNKDEVKRLYGSGVVTDTETILA
ncbi:hypothetical protein EDD18DRAFT_530376 [Armillaria luteobubalina]|uniref:Heterokaryon incompatibility domain-containing protein n=1 Tax=Armillaria luteobubalina TaxID=153913 RepID=A0AA39TJN9_9AGAR|nr:hypothetical protein EDD18DRAFT_530376 [Armillaria luteobubalina]